MVVRGRARAIGTGRRIDRQVGGRIYRCARTARTSSTVSPAASVGEGRSTYRDISRVAECQDPLDDLGWESFEGGRSAGAR